MSFGVFQFRRGTASQWTTANPVLAAGELGVETDTAKFKIGDGTSVWSALPYGGIQGPAGAAGVTPSNQITTNSTQTGLTGDKTTTGSWDVGKLNVTGGAIGATGVGVMDNGNRVYSDSNPPISLEKTSSPVASPPPTPPAGYGVEYLGTEDGIFRFKNAAGVVSTTLSPSDKAILDNHKKGWVNILDYGGDNTNATSSRTALTNAIAALPNGGTVFFPTGQYNFGNTSYQIDTAHITLKGAARYGTGMNTTSLTEDTFKVGQYYVTFEDLIFYGPQTGTGVTLTSAKTAGYAINGAGTNFPSNTTVRRCAFFYQYDCINIGNALMNVDDIDCRYFKHSGVVVTHNSDHQINQMQSDNATSALPTGSGIDIQVTASCLISNCNVIHSGNALNISPATGVTVPSVKALNCFFDTSVNGLNCTGAGSVLRCEFTNCWFSSMSANGINMQPAVGGQVNGVTFINCDVYNNVGGTTQGVNTNAQVGKWKMTGCSIAGWTTGINLVAGASHFPTIVGNTIGGVSAFGNNATGVAVGAGAYKGVVIAENDIIDNTTNFTLGALTITTTTASSHRIIDNAGINPRGSVGTIAVPASTVVQTNLTGFRVMVVVKWAATAPTVVSINGVATVLPAASAIETFTLEPGGTIAYTGTAPTWTWVGQ